VRALVTRPRENAAPLVDALAERGIEAVVEPLIEIRAKPGLRPELGDVQAILLTSANGARAVAAATDRRDLPVYAVGAATAGTAAAHGFADVHSAGGDVESLEALVSASLDPAGGALLHAAGSEIAGDLAGRLDAAGFTVRRAVLYEAVPADALGAAAVAALRTGAIDLALFFSPRTARTFVRLTEAAGATAECARILAFALSPAVAAALAPVSWRGIRVAARPEQAALLALVDRHLSCSGAADAAHDRAEMEPMNDRPETRPETPDAPDRTSSGAPRVTVLPGRTAETPPSTVAPAPSGRGPMFAVSALAVVLLVLGGLAFLVLAQPERLDAWLGRSPAPVFQATDVDERIETSRRELAERLDAAAARLEQLTQSVAALERRPDATTPDATTPDDRAAIDERLAALEESGAALDRKIQELAAGLDRRLEDSSGKLVELAERMEQAASRLQAADEAVSTLGGRVGRIDARTADTAAEHGALLRLSVAQLELALSAGRPFDQALEAVRGLAGDALPASALTGWTDRAAEGIPTVDVLARRFALPAAEALRVPDADAGWIDRTMARLQGMVSIRRVDGDATGDAPDDTVARAEAKLRDGDLTGAVAEVEALPDETRALFAGWLADAHARLAAEAGIEALIASLPAGTPAR